MDAKPADSDADSKQTLHKEPLQVRISRDIKRRFKDKAAMLGIEPNELFVRMWDTYERTEDDRV